MTRSSLPSPARSADPVKNASGEYVGSIAVGGISVSYMCAKVRSTISPGPRCSTVRLHQLHLLGRRGQRLRQRGRIAIGGILHRHRHDGPRVHVDPVLDPVTSSRPYRRALAGNRVWPVGLRRRPKGCDGSHPRPVAAAPAFDSTGVTLLNERQKHNRRRAGCRSAVEHAVPPGRGVRPRVSVEVGRVASEPGRLTVPAAGARAPATPRFASADPETDSSSTVSPPGPSP